LAPGVTFSIGRPFIIRYYPLLSYLPQKLQNHSNHSNTHHESSKARMGHRHPQHIRYHPRSLVDTLVARRSPEGTSRYNLGEAFVGMARAPTSFTMLLTVTAMRHVKPCCCPTDRFEVHT
jgi:hypothetical protein